MWINLARKGEPNTSKTQDNQTPAHEQNLQAFINNHPQIPATHTPSLSKTNKTPGQQPTIALSSPSHSQELTLTFTA
jgi:hypothetical protein